jgi:hypothetical protein
VAAWTGIKAQPHGHTAPISSLPGVDKAFDVLY